MASCGCNAICKGLERAERRLRDRSWLAGWGLHFVGFGGRVQVNAELRRMRA